MAKSTYSPRSLSRQKYRKESENWKLWDCLCILKNKASYDNDSPKQNTLAHNIIYMMCREAACLLMNFLYYLELSYQAHQTTFSVKFVRRCKYCLELP